MTDPIIIIGMQRSGTSWLARTLHAQGVEMYDWTFGNHAEDGDIWGWNSVEMLGNPPDQKAMPFGYTPSNHFISRLEAYQDFRDKGKPWGFKEPRMVMLLGAYAQVFPTAKYICCVRNVLSLIWSQIGRNNNIKPARPSQYIAPVVLRMCNVAYVSEQQGLDIHYFNYDAGIEGEQKALNEFLGMEIDLSDFKRSEASRGYESGDKCPEYEVIRFDPEETKI